MSKIKERKATLNLDILILMYYINKEKRNTKEPIFAFQTQFETVNLGRIDMPIVTSTIKGQIVIPAEIRARFKIKKGTQVNVYDDGERIIVEPIVDDPIQEGRGMLKTKGKILRALVADRKKEAEL